LIFPSNPKPTILKVALAHLIPAPFTQQVALALDERGLLDKFYCTLVNDPESVWQNLARAAGRITGKDVARDLARRAVTEIPVAKVTRYPFRETSRMLIKRIFGNATLDDRVFHWARDGFDSWVAKNLNGVDAVYGYEYGVKATFARAQQDGIRCIYDLPSPEHDFVENLLIEETKRFPELQTPYRRHVERLQADRTEHRRQEWETTDLVVANSTFTANSWIAAGWSKKRVVVVPYGAPPVVSIQKKTKSSGPLRLIWAGTFSIRKGAHYLLEAWKVSFASNPHVLLDVYGAVSAPQSLLENVPENIRFHGSIPRGELYAAYQASDVLMFPTLCDGFGMVVTEAFAYGLPVITTRRAGAADIVREGENGFLIEAGSSAAIASSIQRCLDERQRLWEMSGAALNTAAGLQWKDYRNAIASHVQNLETQK
jgi:glycosyltransferase involved in cell wall biosynthesis